ncbi:FxLYD domain-containing protein [Thalassobacillus devorans]|uniref:FxLYD domain-containing protein n=1 Tax=Thalassobacillus devorans TaxID=279813 RepID=UPI000490AD15|nr:FxLYD domain-containing protein [Thalassobacillus devorans]
MRKCPGCQEEVNEGSRFCPNCGTRLDEKNSLHNDEISATVAEEPSSRFEHKQPKGKKNWKMILLPVIVLLLSAGGVGYTYAYEKNVNEEVLQLKRDAEASALEGKYDEAASMLKSAIDKREDFAVLKKDLAFIKEADGFQEEMKQIEKEIQRDQLAKATDQIAALRENVKASKSKLVPGLLPKLDTMDSQIKIKRINSELAELTTVDQLAANLSTLSRYNLEEATKVKAKIMEKIVTIASNDAENHIEGKEFNKAVAAVDHALQFAVNNDKLLQLKKRIRQEQEAFVQAQRERIERAAEQAAQEDLKNQTAAVEVKNVKAKLDDLGDLTVTGEVKSVATKIISSVTVELEILDKEGNPIKTEENTVTVYPMYLNPGDTGKFEKQFFEINKQVDVKVKNIEWYVE